MNRNEFEEQLLNYVEGELSSEGRSRFEDAAKTVPELQKLLEEYMAVVSFEEELGAMTPTPSPALEVKIMDRVEEIESGIWLIFLRQFRSKRAVIYPLAASIVTATLVFTLTTEQSMESLSQLQILNDKVEVEETSDAFVPPTAPAVVESHNQPSHPEGAENEPKTSQSIQIPPGFRAVTLPVAKSNDTGEISKTGGRVDIVWEYQQSGVNKAATIVRSAKTLNISGSTQLQDKGSAVESSSITLLVTERDAKKLELARSMGNLTVNTPGDQESSRSATETRMYDLIAAPSAHEPREVAEVANDGVMYSNDPRTGRDIRYVLKNGRWSLDQSITSYNPADRIVSPSRDQFVAYEENPRVRTTLEPMSTFGVDVDTASYTIARRQLSIGRLPAPESVRVEEFVNYFSYDYPVEYEKPFSVAYEIAPSPVERGRHLLKLAIKSRDLKESTKPWNLVFLIDTSGSMASADRLELVKSGLRSLVETMRSSDRIAIVTYAGTANIALQSTTLADKTRIISTIDSLYASGSTYGEGGIKLAYDVAQRNFISAGVNRVILATDGDFNVGTSSHDELLRLIEQKRKSGVSLTALGVGLGNLNDATLEQLANKGNGNYFYLDTLQEARRVLGDEVTSTMEIVAKDVKLQVEFNPAHVAEYRLIGYDNRRMENAQFNDDSVDSGEIGSGHSVTALYEITLTNSPVLREQQYRYGEPEPSIKQERTSSFENELGFVKIRFKSPEASESQLMEFPLRSSAILPSSTAASDDFRFAAAVAYFAQTLRKSKFSAGYNLLDLQSLVEGALGADSDGKRKELLELLKNASTVR